MPGTIEVLCLAFPDGTTHWGARDALDTEAVVQAWKDSLSSEKRARYLDAGVQCGFVILRMLPEDLKKAPPTRSWLDRLFCRGGA